MKILATTLLVGGITLMSVMPTFAQLESTNLLANPGAEKNLEGEWKIWTGNLERRDDYGRNIFPYKGNYFFKLFRTTKITQDIDISDYASTIDNKTVNVKAGAWFQNSNSNTDCFFRFQYYGDNASYLTEESETFNCQMNDWSERQVIKTIPPLTRTITFEIRTVTCSGCDLLFDEAYLNILEGPIIESLLSLQTEPLQTAQLSLQQTEPSQTAPCPVVKEPVCGLGGCAWSSLPDPNLNYIPIDRFLADDGNLWHNPLRFQSSGVYPHSEHTQYDATHFAPNSYQHAIEGFFQIRHACQASWYSDVKDLFWIPANIVGAIEYCVYPENIQEVVNHLRTVADQLACENDLPECNQ